VLDFTPILCQGRPVGITARQFQQLQERLNPTRRRSSAIVVPSVTPLPRQSTVLLGVDPSLRGTGYGIIRLGRPYPTTLAQGTIRCPAGWARSRCLALIAETLREAIRKHHPTTCVVEGLFHAQNLQTALLMGEARGAALVAAAEAGLDIFELAPRKVKQAIVGFGGAHKQAVARMVQRLLGLEELPEPDAADALALALAHAQEQGRHALTATKPI
jgi:crossover junction endodeoxyribonuclease RuvC